jgi:hypothetical protein
MKVGFLHNLFRYECHIGLEVLYEIFESCISEYSDYEVEDFWQSGRKIFLGDVSHWEIYQEENAEISEEMFAPELFRKNLIIGFEIPPSICHLLTLKKIPYLNFFNHSVRFLPDLLWAVSTNSYFLAKRLRCWNIKLTQDNVQTYVNNIKIHTAGQRIAQKFLLDKGTVVIFGQTKEDSSVLSAGRFMNLYDYRKEIKQIVGETRNIIIIPHPLENDYFSLVKLVQYLGRGIITNLNSYSVLSDENVTDIITLSSSIGVESRYFGKNVHFLLGEALRVGGSMVAGDAHVFTLGQDILKNIFWQSLNLAQLAYPKNHFRFGSIYDNLILTISNTLNKNKLPCFSQKNYFRTIFGGWAFETIEKINLQSIFVRGIKMGNKRKLAKEKGMKVDCLENKKVIDFSKDESLSWISIDGFSGAEPDGRWTDGNIARVRIPNSKLYLKGYFCFIVEPFLSGGIVSQNGEVYVDGVKKGAFNLHINSKYHMLVPNIQIANIDEIKIEFRFMNSKSPLELGVSDDSRKLSLKFLSCEYFDDSISAFQVIMQDSNY